MPESIPTQINSLTDKLMDEMSKYKASIDKKFEKLGAGTSAEDKQIVNKMAEDHQKHIKKYDEDMSELKTRVSEMEEAQQEDRQKRFEFNSTNAILNPYKDAHDHLFREIEDPSKASEADMTEAITKYGQRVGHKSNFVNLVHPGRMKHVLTPEAFDSTSNVGGAEGTLTPMYQEAILPPAQEQRTLIDTFPMVMTNYEKLIWRQERLARRIASRDALTGADKNWIQSLDYTGSGQGDEAKEMLIEFETKEEEMRTFAAVAFASIQILQDVGYMQAYIGNQLEYEAERGLSQEILYGTNKASSTYSLNGLDAHATEVDDDLIRDVVSGNTHYVDALRTSWLQASLTHIQPTVHLMHDTDYTSMLLEKDNDGRYMFVPNINNPTMLSPLGMPIAMSTYITQDNFFTVPANQCMVCMKRGWESGLSYEDEKNFRELKVTFRVWGRWGFVNFRPSSTNKGTFSELFKA